MEIKIGTFNILNTSCRYEERVNYLIKSFEELQCDIYGVQEVNFLGNHELLTLLGYKIELIQLPNPFLKEEKEFRIDGNAILYKDSYEVVGKFELTFQNNLRAAQFIHFRKGQTEFILGNTHLDHLSNRVRTSQVQELLKFTKTFPDLPIIITGDFNFTPFSEPYNLMTEYFISSYKKLHNREAALTFPTGLMGKYADPNENGALDYIWIKGNIECIESAVFTNCGHGEVWASDHYPVYSRLVLLI